MLKKRLQVVPILCQINPFHTLASYCFKIYFNIIFHLGLDLRIDLLPSHFITKSIYAFIFSGTHATCPSYLVVLNLNV